MLSLLNNHYSPRLEIVYDQEINRGYLLIPKNASTSMRASAERNPKRFLHLFNEDAQKFLESKNISVLTVFVRDPIERFLSGLNTQRKLYGFVLESVLKCWESSETVDFFDSHTAPQFLFLLRSTLFSDFQFDILGLEKVNEIYPQEELFNVSRSKKIKWDQISKKLQERIVFFYTEDIVLHNQFLNRTATLKEIISQIAKEKVFVENYRQSCQVLTYL
jgi:hypothetical protein